MMVPFARSCPISSSMQPSVQVLDPPIKVRFVGPPRQPVDPWCSISLEREGSKALSQISTTSCRRDTTSSRQGD